MRTSSRDPNQRNQDKRPSHQPIDVQLAQLFLFAGWSPSDVQSIVHHTALRIRERGEVLFTQGDACSQLHVLVRGRVQVYRMQPDGNDVTIHTVGAVGLIACAALFVDGSYPASARVVSSTAELLTIQGDPFLALLGSRPDLSRRMIATLASRLTELADSLESQAADTAVVRLAKWLLDLPRQPGPTMRVIVPGTKKRVASALGMTPETLSRCLSHLSKEGMIRVDGPSIDIIHVDNLLAIVDPP